MKRKVLVMLSVFMIVGVVANATPPVIWMQYTEIGGLWFWLPFFNV